MAQCILTTYRLTKTSVTFYGPQATFNCPPPVRPNSDLFYLPRLPGQARPHYQKKGQKMCVRVICVLIFNSRTRAPAFPAFKWHLWIFIASIGVESVPSINDYWWCRRIVMRASANFQEGARGHRAPFGISRHPLEATKVPRAWFISPLSAYVCAGDVILGGLNQTEGNPEASDQCRETRGDYILILRWCMTLIIQFNCH